MYLQHKQSVHASLLRIHLSSSEVTPCLLLACEPPRRRILQTGVIEHVRTRWDVQLDRRFSL